MVFLEDGVNMNVIYEDNHLLVIDKPYNLLSQADNTSDEDVITLAKQFLKEKYNKPGNVYCGLVHRLDRVVSGLMVLAKTSKAASRLSNQVRLNQFEKKYIALVENKPQKGKLIDYLIKDEKTNIVTTTSSSHGKYSELNISDVQHFCENYFFVELTLVTGRSHQIRVQLSSRNTPIVNDHRYNPNAQKGQPICLVACELSFFHPITKEKLTFQLDGKERIIQSLS